MGKLKVQNSKLKNYPELRMAVRDAFFAESAKLRQKYDRVFAQLERAERLAGEKTRRAA